MAEPIAKILDRIKNLKQFEVEVDIPEGFHLDGVIPYDVTISKNKGIFKIFASSKEDAQKQIDSYIQESMQE
jgi:hypothetical protein